MITQANVLKNEIAEWLIILTGLEKQNVAMKIRISLAVQNTLNRDFVDLAEYFQQLFINYDQMIRLLRHDIQDFLIQIGGAEELPDTCIPRQHFDSLKNEMMKSVFEFNKTRISIDDLLSFN